MKLLTACFHTLDLVIIRRGHSRILLEPDDGAHNITKCLTDFTGCLFDLRG